MANRVERNQDRRARAEALRKEQETKARRRRLLLIVVLVAAVLVVAAIVASLLLTQRGSTSTTGSSTSDRGAAQIVPTTPTGSTTVEATPKRVADDSGIDGVIAWDTEGWPGDGTDHAGALEHDHVATPVTYAVTPPVGGPHDAVWMNAGVYTKPVPPERAVHNLEHGAVWITYRPSLPSKQVRALQQFVGTQSLIPEQSQTVAGQKNRYVDLSPWTSDALPSKIVISAWGHQLRVSSASDPRLQTFIDTFRNSSRYSPEYGAAVDGVPIQTGGRPAMFGSAKANPAGTAAG